MPRYKTLTIVLASLVAIQQMGYSQTTFASVTGTVTDPAGALVPNATITATNAETNIQSTAKSNDSGVFTIAQLKEGRYTVRAEAPGFRSFSIESISLVTETCVALTSRSSWEM